MKKITACLLSILMLTSFLTSCLPSANETEAPDTFSESESLSESVGEATENEGSDTSTEPTPARKALLVGYRTKESLYDGAFNSQVGWRAAGMGYFVRTPNGHFIVVDGGNTEDAADFYALLKEYSGSEKVVVDYWIITHPHGDHANCLVEMCKNEEIAKNLSIKNLVYHFPEDFKNGELKGWIESMEKIAEQMGATKTEVRKGKLLMIDGVKIKFLYVANDYESVSTANEISLVFTITSEKKVMMTGDIYTRGLKKLAEDMGESLDCDVLQMPHHFLCDTGYLEFYQYANAETVLLPTCIAGYRAMYNDPSYMNSTKHLANKWAEDNAETVYKAFDGNFEFEI